jgi:ABC-type transport system involved in Fe-S cluster assembly fused permease/ATPase subunit
MTYLAEVLYYLVRSVSSDYVPDHSAVSNCFGSILLWGSLSIALWKVEEVRWNLYLSAFVLDFVFDITVLFLNGAAVPHKRLRLQTTLVLTLIRSVLSFALVVTWLSLLSNRKSEKGTDEEGQSLLGNPANGTAAPKTNGEYGAVSQDSSAPKPPADPNKEILEQQAKRFEESGWIGYVKGFAIFLPYLWPARDRLIMFCLFLRGVNLLVVRVFNVLAPRELGIITDELAAGTTTMPWKHLLLWTFYYWIKGYSGFGIIDNLAAMLIRTKSSARISLMAYKHVMNLSMDFHTNKSTGEILKAVDQADSLHTLIDTALFHILPIIMDLVISIWYVTHLFSTYMAYIVITMAAVYVWTGVTITNFNRVRRRFYVEKQRAENQIVNETLHNWHTVSYFNRALYEQTRYATAIRSTISALYEYYFKTMGGYAFQDIIMTFGFTSCCTFAIYQIITGAKPVGNLVTFMMYWNTMMSPLHMMIFSWRSLNNSLIDAERLLQLLNTKPSVTDADDAQPLVVKAGNVEFKDVEFAYDPRKQIINKVNLSVQGGQTVAFVGETGGGKSTMLKLLSRAYDVTGGSISIDGQDLRSVTRSSLREAMGLVPQDPALFNISIRENIRYGRLEATDAEIEDACRAAAIHDAITEFPDGYDSKVGERGVKLSGGQLQRIAIARILLRNPKIVLLDEATSAVDSATEATIQEAFKKLSTGRTTFVIAHRLSTIVDADQICVVDKGEIVQRGTHAQLLEMGGKYAELWTKQTAGHSSKASSTVGGESEVLIDITPVDADTAKTTGRSDDNKDVKKR